VLTDPQFIHHAWYVVAWDHEVQADTVLARRALDIPLVIWRSSNGAVVVMQDACPHRLAPLSLGRREGDAIRCMYHGLKFGADGQCIEVPGQERTPPKACVPTYPAVQRARWIWVWFGDPAEADPGTIPDTFSLDHPDWRMKPGYKHFPANWLLITDNLLDFSHLSYVHEKTLGGSTAIAEAHHDVTENTEGLRVFRRVRNTVPAPYHRQVGRFDGAVNRWFDYTLSYTGLFMMHACVQSVDKADDDLQGALQFHSCQALTPETPQSTHYFFAQAHAFALDDASITESIYQSVANAFDEDLRMIAAQQRNLAVFGAQPMVPIGADGALVRYRRQVQALLDAERAGAAR
jgi:phenylpropionate dioxygenase-like ring-hydroxylating dioxygenase large terminal subunit